VRVRVRARVGARVRRREEGGEDLESLIYQQQQQ